MKNVKNQILSDLYFSREGAKFVEDLVDGFGSRWGGSDEERAAADFIKGKMESFKMTKVVKEGFDCTGWVRKNTKLTMTAPFEQELDVMALPFCPTGTVEAPLVYLGDGDPQAYEDNRERLKGSIAMVLTATPRFYHRTMHRGEKLGRALEAGAIGFVWMRGAPGGLPETGSARFNKACEVPAISVSYETGHKILRAARKGQVTLKIESDNYVQPTHSYNVIGELTGTEKSEEIIVIGGHYDGHDINESANDNGAGVAVVMEAARALAPHKELLKRTIRFIAFSNEETGLIGSEMYAKDHQHENIVFMLNLDGAGRGSNGTFALQGWSESIDFFRQQMKEMHEEQIAVGDKISLYSDMYYFACKGIPSASYSSSAPNTSGAPRGYGHTYWDTLDKLNPRAIEMDSIMVAHLIYRLATMGEFPMKKKTAQDYLEKLKAIGYDDILRYETRPMPGEEQNS